MKPPKLLTEVELELMNAVWDLGECTVKDVQAALSTERELAYTSVATMMKILEQKGIVKSRKAERAHTFRALVSRAEYESASLKHLAENVFRGGPSSMVMRLLDDQKIAPSELRAIRDLLEKRIGK